MTEFIALIALIILAETSYLTYRGTRTNKIKHDSILLDTSVLIDGRIVDIARSGLLTAPLIIPKSVMHELQYMADKADHNKRERARFGLEVIEKLQEIEQTDLTIIDDGTTDVHGVDEQLIVLAKRYGARLCTIDYNLNKVARVQDVIVVNINELAHALRIVHLPGETIDVKLVQTGQEKKQAVGYLEDGTMMVVDDARDLVGQIVPVEITRALQTAAGSMMFARLVSKKPKQNQGSAKRPSETRRASSQSRSEATMVARDSVQTTSGNAASMVASSDVASVIEAPTPVAAPVKPHAVIETQTPQQPSPAQTPRTPRPPRQRAPQHARSEQPQQQRNSRQNKPAPRRRQDIEDSLIELANK